MLVLCVVVLSLSGNALGATISGSIYDVGLDKENDVIVEIDTIPAQTIISKDGDYSITVKPGSYTIHAYTDSSEAFENISIAEDGDYIIDIILLESTSDSYIYDDFSGPEGDAIDVSSELPLNSDYSKIIIIVIISLVVIAALYVLLFYLRNKFAKESDAIIHAAAYSESDKEHILDQYEKKILSIIKKEKRTTQKDIRKEIPLSESKISLVIADLESKGKIRKIKKGRGNILIFEKD